jgi:hypothetical protein
MFEPSVFFFEFFQTLCVVCFHPAVLVSPAIKSLFGHTKLLDDLRNGAAAAKNGVGVTR